MNWAAWEYQIACGKRLTAWRVAGANKVPGSRRTIYDTRQPAHPALVDFEYNKGSYTHLYGGAISGRMGSGKMTATMIAMQQQSMSRLMRPVQQKLTEFYSHAIDAMAYLVDPKNIGKKIKIRMPSDYHPASPMWDWVGKRVETPKYYERAGTWQSNLTASVRLPSVTSLNEPRTSRSAGNKSKHGWLSRMPRKFMA